MSHPHLDIHLFFFYCSEFILNEIVWLLGSFVKIIPFNTMPSRII